MREKQEKKKKRRLRLWVKIVIILLILAVLGAGGYAAKWYYDKITFDPVEPGTLSYDEYCSSKLDEEAKALVMDFSHQILEAQAKLQNEDFNYLEFSQEEIDKKIPDFTHYFTKANGYAASVFQESIRLLVTARTLSPNDLNFDKATYQLIIKDVQKSKGKCKITYVQDDQISFRFLKGVVSESYHLPCELTLKKVDGQWKIFSVYREDDYYLTMSGMVKKLKEEEKLETGDAVKTAFEETRSKYLDNVEKREKQKAAVNDGTAPIPKLAAPNAYDREKALAYAKKYVKKRNTSKYTSYDEIGGNCQNFGSQVLLAGGIPMDVVGDQTWKYYGDQLDWSHSRTGRTGSWTAAPHFHFYAKYNKGFGLVSVVDGNLYFADAGDILQVGAKKGEYTHTNVVIGTVKDEEGKVIDILFNSNTNNRINWPFSTSLSGAASLVHVLGWNN